METFLKYSASIATFLSCSYPTYEEWKPVIILDHLFKNSLGSSYPTYEEWKTILKSILVRINVGVFRIVLILPMRNGNSPVSMYTVPYVPLCSYPTYEEWKQINTSFNLPEIRVLILPMRNGNGEDWKDAAATFAASLSYPWGMETLVLQVYQMGVNLSLSYLWGMETFLSFSLIITSPSSYPTYEEWKRIYSHPAKKQEHVLILPMRNGNSSQCWTLP